MRRPTPARGTREVPLSCDRPRESVEQRPFREILRMPLDCDYPSVVRIRRLGALDHAIVGPRDRFESRCEIADRLVVPAVHRGRACAERFLEDRSRLYAPGMMARVVAVNHG